MIEKRWKQGTLKTIGESNDSHPDAIIRTDNITIAFCAEAQGSDVSSGGSHSRTFDKISSGIFHGLRFSCNFFREGKACACASRQYRQFFNLYATEGYFVSVI